jgi:hypothetical protein
VAFLENKTSRLNLDEEEHIQVHEAIELGTCVQRRQGDGLPARQIVESPPHDFMAEEQPQQRRLCRSGLHR